MSLFDDPLPPSCHLKSPFGEPPPPLHVGDVLCERPLYCVPVLQNVVVVMRKRRVFGSMPVDKLGFRRKKSGIWRSTTKVL